MLQTMKKGFTLIELLVVITIIGILATWAVSVYTTQIQKARDSNRISDIQVLRWGIEQHFQDEWQYPIGFAGWKIVKTYVPNLVEDPNDGSNCNGSLCWYAYIVWDDSNNVSNASYELSTAFENESNVRNKAIDDTGSFTGANDDNSRMEIIVWGINRDTKKDVNGTWGTKLESASTNARVHIEKWAVTAF